MPCSAANGLQESLAGPTATTLRASLADRRHSPEVLVAQGHPSGLAVLEFLVDLADLRRPDSHQSLSVPQVPAVPRHPWALGVPYFLAVLAGQRGPQLHRRLSAQRVPEVPHHPWVLADLQRP